MTISELSDQVQDKKQQILNKLKTESDLHIDKDGSIYTTLSLSKSIEKYFCQSITNNILDEPSDVQLPSNVTYQLQLINYFKSNGYTIEQACAITAIAQCESKCNPSYINMTEMLGTDTSSPACRDVKGNDPEDPNNMYAYSAGLLGFRYFSRKKKLLNYIGIKFPDDKKFIEHCTLLQQGKMIVSELKDSDYSSVNNQIKENDNINNIVSILYSNYSNRKESLQNAISYAKYFLEKAQHK